MGGYKQRDARKRRHLEVQLYVGGGVAAPLPHRAAIETATREPRLKRSLLLQVLRPRYQPARQQRTLCRVAYEPTAARGLSSQPC